ncbi:MAG: hypothetical protein U5K37_08105 [Natrialbaceae archaeon]|nr:hypothetical protein [Natrialbaceae archaeon]
MDERRQLEQRLAAVERAVVDGNGFFGDLTTVAALTDDLDQLTGLQETLEDRIATLEGDVAALRGCLDTLAVEDEEVADRAELALVRVEQLERRLASIEATPSIDPPPRTCVGTDTLASQLFERTARVGPRPTPGGFSLPRRVRPTRDRDERCQERASLAAVSSVIRLVVAVALTVAILSIAVPAIETGATYRSERVLGLELDRVVTAATALATHEDPLVAGPGPRPGTHSPFPRRPKPGRLSIELFSERHWLDPAMGQSCGIGCMAARSIRIAGSDRDWRGPGGDPLVWEGARAEYTVTLTVVESRNDPLVRIRRVERLKRAAR